MAVHNAATKIGDEDNIGESVNSRKVSAVHMSHKKAKDQQLRERQPQSQAPLVQA